MSRREAQSLEEQIVAEIARAEGCVQEDAVAVIPPPEDCSYLVGAAYFGAKIHLLTIFVVIAFVVILLQLILKEFTDAMK